MPDAGRGHLPTLVIIGERRSGTTWLSRELAGHPAIFVHPKRDRGYFLDDDARKGRPVPPWEQTHSVEDYRSMFQEFDTSGYVHVCEKSADYLFWRPAHQRMAHFLPRAKYIAILRHPVRRAWSHYWIEVGKGRERLDFAAALAVEAERAAARPYDRNHLSYRARGCYDESLGDFLSLIPRDSLHVVTLEEMIADRAGVMRGIFDFLGVEDLELAAASTDSQNRNWVMMPKQAIKAAGLGRAADGYAAAVDFALKRSVANRDRRRRVAVALKAPLFDPASTMTMDDDCARGLASFYRPHVERLETLLGRSFGHWRI